MIFSMKRRQREEESHRMEHNTSNQDGIFQQEVSMHLLQYLYFSGHIRTPDVGFPFGISPRSIVFRVKPAQMQPSGSCIILCYGLYSAGNWFAVGILWDRQELFVTQVRDPILGRILSHNCDFHDLNPNRMELINTNTRVTIRSTRISRWRRRNGLESYWLWRALGNCIATHSPRYWAEPNATTLSKFQGRYSTLSLVDTSALDLLHLQGLPRIAFFCWQIKFNSIHWDHAIRCLLQPSSSTWWWIRWWLLILLGLVTKKHVSMNAVWLAGIRINSLDSVVIYMSYYYYLISSGSIVELWLLSNYKSILFMTSSWNI